MKNPVFHDPFKMSFLADTIDNASVPVQDEDEDQVVPTLQHTTMEQEEYFLHLYFDIGQGLLLSALDAFLWIETGERILNTYLALSEEGITQS